MRDVEVLIRIPEAWIEAFKAFKYPSALQVCVLQGTVLTKGHGTLKDTDAICKDIISALGIPDECYLLEAEEAVYKRIKNAPTIIEADKEGEDESD